MKTCQTCGATTFDDMEMCFECMSSFTEAMEGNALGDEQAAVKLHIALADYFSYELLLYKMEGRSLSIGSAQENAIVIPQEQVAAHQLEMFYARGHIWAESVDPTLSTTIGEIPLCGTVLIEPGTEIVVGDATITMLE